MNIKKLIPLLSAVGFGLALASAPASAVTFYFPITSFQDDDLDYIVDANNNGIVDTGDRLISVFEFESSQGELAGQGPSSILPAELTGVADLTVIGISGSTLILEPTGAGGLLAGFAAGTAAAVWLDPSPDLDVINSNCGTRAQCIALAEDGALYLTIGFFGDPDDLWVATPSGAGSFNIGTIEGGGSGTTFGTYNYSLQIGVNNTGFTFGPVACGSFCGPGGNGLVQITGSGNVLGGISLDHTQWTARSDADARLAPLQVPEPGSLALLGIALAGFGGIQLRRKLSN